MRSATNGSNGAGTIDLKQLFQAAEDEGTLSPAARAVLDVPDLGARIQEGLGIKVDDVQSSEVVLVTFMPDDSGSIQFAGNAQVVRDGHNLVLDALIGCRQRDSILAHNRYLNGQVLYPYCPIARATRMTAQNYQPDRGTPLFDQTVVLLGTVIAKTQELAGSGVPARDGHADPHRRRRPGLDARQGRDVKAIVRDMAAAENHIVAAMGIDDGSTAFRDVFRSMGIDDRWILTPGNDPARSARRSSCSRSRRCAPSQGAPRSRARRRGVREVGRGAPDRRGDGHRDRRGARIGLHQQDPRPRLSAQPPLTCTVYPAG